MKIKNLPNFSFDKTLYDYTIIAINRRICKDITNACIKDIYINDLMPELLKYSLDPKHLKIREKILTYYNELGFKVIIKNYKSFLSWDHMKFSSRILYAESLPR